MLSTNSLDKDNFKQCCQGEYVAGVALGLLTTMLYDPTRNSLLHRKDQNSLNIKMDGSMKFRNPESPRQ